ncbi:hypothetical protein HMF7854_09380 [Sphingomonas ginkgonis]|uniref:Phytoene synthase n=1 Tax=Sphingomonas ginkgonis TaxID=2315330 RepID=A0A429VAQ4_9SPHN|nr:hypothetical protein [Sphingomonas ginkgonis]RST31026.1 hypothetical protein HMF7854_09380 [Sphingomonas ginkgonis]
MVASSSQPPLGAVRLAWWREQLEQLDSEGHAAPAEPRLQASEAELLVRGISGAELSRLEDGWLPLLEPFPWGAEQVAGLKRRGRMLFALAARLLQADVAAARPAGEFWSLVDGARHASDDSARALLLGAARELLTSIPPAPRQLRAISVLSALSAYDLASGHPLLPEPGPARGWAALRHRLTGALTR